MESETIRNRLLDLSKTRGELKKFCDKNKLPYVSVWKFANKTVEKVEYELGLKLAEALAAVQEKDPTQVDA